MTGDRPYSSAQAFEQRIQDATDTYVAAGYKVDENTIKKQRPDRLDPLSPSAWTGSPPPHNWVVDGCFLNRTVGQISGDGGLGKSLLMQQLCTAAALGRPWLGLPTKACKSLAVFCEDDAEELWRRQVDINHHYECTPADLAGRILYAPRPGMENVMVEFPPRGNKPTFLPLFEETREQALRFGAQIIILDTQADVYSGNEIARDQASRFVTALRRLAIEIDGIVILTAHPSLTGMSTGSGRSGSTGWSNKVRSRVYLTSPTQTEDEQTNERLLKTMKNNHGPSGGKIRLMWDKGVFILADAIRSKSPLERMDADGRVFQAFCEIMKAGTMVSASPQNRSCLSSIARHWPGLEGMRAVDIVGSQMRLLRQGRIVQVEVGPESKRRSYLRTPEMRLPGETVESPE